MPPSAPLVQPTDRGLRGAPRDFRSMTPPIPCALLLALTAFSAPAKSAGAAQIGDRAPVRPFSLPDASAARALAERADDHLARRRWKEGITDLQALLEEHRGEVLGPDRPAVGGRRSEEAVHPGAARWARERLFALPPEAVRLYRERYEETARGALAAALNDQDAGALAEVAARWPLTEAAQHAWWALGDIEFERGDCGAARLAWGRALAATLGDPSRPPRDAASWSAALEEIGRRESAIPNGLRRRLELALESARDDERAPDPTGEVPGPDATSWARPLPLPAHPFDRQRQYNLLPVRSGDLVLVSTSLRLLAIQAFSGELVWDSGEPPGWGGLTLDQRDEFFTGIDRDGALIAPAANERIAVAALQIPISEVENKDFNSIPILRVIPDRRLFAFDIETGRELWNHMPPPGWSGEGGTFPERMRVAGPPVIAGTRVIVPTYRMQGRIDFHVAAYELATGELLWSTPVISGQRELNMFNRHAREYSAPPVVVADDRIVVLTQLGSIAALDFFSGRILWETLYEQIPLPQRNNYTARMRETTWRNGPPAVADGVVVAAPADSRRLVGIDLESGAMLWSLALRKIAQLAGGSEHDIDLLLGADERTVYLAGRRIVALEAGAGLYRGRPVRVAWTFAPPALRDADVLPRPALTADRIVVPTPTQRLDVGRFTGTHVTRPLPWRDGRGGNVLVTGGSLFTLDHAFLNAYFEWDSLVRRAREEHAARPEDPEAALALADLLAERGRSAHRSGRSDRGREFLAQAREVLRPFAAAPEGAAVRARLFEVLRAQARVQADLADAAGALRTLAAAEELAPTPRALRDALLDEERLVRELAPERRPALLERIAAEGGELPLECIAGPQSATSVLGGLEPALESQPEEFDGAARFTLPTAAWATLARCATLARAGDVEGELAALHLALARWPEAALPAGTLRQVVTARIGELARSAPPEMIAPYERRAREAFDAAVAARDTAALERVPALYPHTRAAHEAHDALLALALEDGQLDRVAQIVLAELPLRWSPARATTREAETMAALAAALEREGNRRLAADLLAALARARPTLTSLAPGHGGRALAELAAARAASDPPPPPPATFDAPSRALFVEDGERTPLGIVPPADERSAGAIVRVVGRRALREGPRGQLERKSSIEAYRDDSPGPPVWRWTFPGGRAPDSFERSVATAPGIVLAAEESGLVALDRGGGEERWHRTLRIDGVSGGRIESVRAAGGLAVVVLSPGGSEERFWALGLDIQTGTTLWRQEFEREQTWPVPLVSAERVVFLPRRYTSRTVLVLDAFSGREVAQAQLPFLLLKSAYEASWIEDDRLFVPWFLQHLRPERNRLLAIDLESGEIAYEVDFDSELGGGRELYSIVQHAGRTFLVLQPRPAADGADTPGILAELHTRLGALARAGDVVLGGTTQAVGVPRETRVVLEEPLLLLRSIPPEDGLLRLVAVELPGGLVRWTWRPGLDIEQLYSLQMPLPAVSDRTVAVCFSERPERGSRYRTRVSFLDRASGRHRGTIELERGFGRSDMVRLVPLGDALLFAGQDLSKVMR